MVKLINDELYTKGMDTLQALYRELNDSENKEDKSKLEMVSKAIDLLFGYDQYSFENEVKKGFIDEVCNYPYKDKDFEIYDVINAFIERELTYNKDLCLYTHFLDKYVEEVELLGEGISHQAKMGGVSNPEWIFARACLEGFINEEFSGLIELGDKLCGEDEGATEAFSDELDNIKENLY